MYVNKCIKCGKEFETKNPKRVICPDCLYPEKKPGEDVTPSQHLQSYTAEQPQQSYNSYSTEDRHQEYNRDRDRGGYSSGGYSAGGYSAGGGYNRDRGSYNRDNRSSYQNRDNRGGYNRDRGNYNRDNRGDGYNRENRPSRGGYNNNYQDRGRRPQGGGFNNRRPQNNRFNKRPQRPKQDKPLLVSKEQLETIEALYKTMLPLPNPDAHEVIGEKMQLEPRKVFFGINLVRQKLMLPKLPYPKRKLAITPDQMMAIKSLYAPLLPLPPIGCHKIIAVQLRMDEWRVHVGIGLIRAQMGLERWNPDREDAPEEFKNQPKVEETIAVAETSEVVEEKPKRGRKPKKTDEE